MSNDDLVSFTQMSVPFRIRWLVRKYSLPFVEQLRCGFPYGVGGLVEDQLGAGGNGEPVATTHFVFELSFAPPRISGVNAELKVAACCFILERLLYDLFEDVRTGADEDSGNNWLVLLVIVQ